MDCKFFTNGLAISYDQIVKPCCSWQVDTKWKNDNRLRSVDLGSWHSSFPIIEKKEILDNGHWPSNCSSCQRAESQGRQDSMRYNGNRAYAHYNKDDITLEIRPGSTCNFACQTCWPEASSRVAQYQHQLGMIDITTLDSRRLDDFDFLLPIASRIKDVVLLGGEPFYDKSCKRFIEWAKQHLSANLLLFTNGSCLDWKFLEEFPGKITLVFSLDAMGKAAEYIREGTEWQVVEENFNRAKKIPNVEVRVNITTSVYNIIYLKDLLSWLATDWPTVVSFGSAKNDIFTESVIPMQHRSEVSRSLESAMKVIVEADIESGQKSNALQTLKSIIANLSLPWNADAHSRIIRYITMMDSVKNKSIQDYCPEISRLLEQKIH